MAHAAIADALAEQPVTAQAVEAIGTLLAGQARSAFESDAQRKGLRWDGPLAEHHVWCEAVTAVADALVALRDAATQVENRAAEWIALPVATKGAPPYLRTLAEIAAKSLVRALRTSAIDPTEWVPALRILAVLMCPDPAAHPELVRRSLPSLRRFIGESLSDRVVDTFEFTEPDAERAAQTA